MSAYPEVSEVFEERGLGLDIEAGCDPEPGPAGHSKYRVAAVLAGKHRGENGHIEVTLFDGFSRVHQHVLCGDIDSSEKHRRSQDNHDSLKHFIPPKVFHN